MDGGQERTRTMPLQGRCGPRTWVLAALLAGCASAPPPGTVPNEFGAPTLPKFKTTVDQFTGDTTTQSEEVELPKIDGPMSRVTLTWYRAATRKGSVGAGMYIQYTSRDWLFIAPGASLILLVDGEARELATETDPARRVLSGGTVLEVAAYPVTLALLRDMAGAKDLRLRVIGSQGSADRRFPPHGFTITRAAIPKLFPDSTR